MSQNEGRLTEEDIQLACNVLRRVQASTELSEAEKPALSCVTSWLSTHLPVCQDEETNSPKAELLQSQCFPIVEAFQAVYRHSTREQRERVLRMHSRKSSMLSGDLVRGGSFGGSFDDAALIAVLSQDPRVRDLLNKVGSWEGFDVFQLDQLTGGRPLEHVALAALQQLGVIDGLQLPVKPLRKYLRVIEQHYTPNPYHCGTHAADVVQACTAILLTDQLPAVLTQLEVLALVLAAVVHDVDHPGVTNDFLIRTRDERAITYNDISCNENHHLATAFRLLLVPEHNFLGHLSHDDFTFVRGLVVDLVLSTDMKAHHSLIDKLRTDLQLFGPDLTTWNSVGRTHALSLLLHCADISNSLREYPLCMQWTRRVMSEFWAQGAREASLGIPVSPLNNKEDADVPKSQQVFLELFVKPCFELLPSLAPITGAYLLRQFETNSARYIDMCRRGIKALPEQPEGGSSKAHRLSEEEESTAEEEEEEE